MAADGKKNIHAGHRARMRERFYRSGLDAFEPHEVMELLLFEFIPVVNTNPLAHALIKRFGSVKNVLTAAYDELTAVSGVGPKTAEGLMSLYPILSNNICDRFREVGVLTRYDLAFLADWFMDYVPAGSMGLILCGTDRRFRDFVRLRVSPDDLLFDLSTQIVHAARDMTYYLLVKEDFSLITREKAQMLRQITGRGRAVMLDVFVLEGCCPTSIFYM